MRCKVSFVSFLVVGLLSSVRCLYEDQIGKFDWRKQLIGRVDHLYFSSSTRRICVATNQNVVAALNFRTGNIIWRQIYESGENGKIDLLRGWGDEIFVLSGNGKFIRNWDITTGYLQWEVPVSLPFRKNILGSQFQLMPHEDKLISAVFTKDYFVHIDAFNYSTGSIAWSESILVPWASHPATCKFIDYGYFVCVDHTDLIIYTMKIGPHSKFSSTKIPDLQRRDSVKEIEIINLQRETGSEDFVFAINIDKSHAKVVEILNGELSFKLDIPEAFAISMEDVNKNDVHLFILQNIDGHFKLNVISLTDNSKGQSVTDIEIQGHYGIPLKMWITGFPRKEGDHAHRILFATEDDGFLMYQMNGKLLWSREEALASIISVEMIDLPVSDSEIQFEQEFRLDDTNVLSMLLKRLSSQLYQVESSILNVLSGLTPGKTSAVAQTQTVLTRDVFNLHKIIVAVATSGKIFGIDSITGKIIWQNLVKNLKPFDMNGKNQLFIFTQTKTLQFPQSPQCAVVGVDKYTRKGLLYLFHPISGAEKEGGSISLDFHIAQATLLPQSDDTYSRGILFLDTYGKIHVHPKSAMEIAKRLSPSLFLYTANTSNGQIVGYSLHPKEKEIVANPIWNIKFPASHTISQIIVKPAIEHVHSQGRVMADRSVMYKYLNPNLVTVISEGTDNQQKPFFKILLLDVVTGSIIFSGIHKRCRGPIHVVTSENWVVYAYFSEKARRTEVSVLELYEGKIQSNTTAFSSLNPPQFPMVERQAYLFPAGLEAMAVTITEKGITSKHLLFALPYGGLVELPKSLLDPRRALILTQEHREESVYPYVPELPVPSENIINYNQSIFHIRQISSAPAGLESTCLVFAFGLDLFFASITPSRTFDVLKDDFDHFLITVVLSGLILAAYLIRQLAARKALHQAWK